MFRFWAFCHERGPGQAGYPTLRRLYGKLSPRLIGLPYLADWATRLGGSPHLSYKRDQNKIGNYMNRRVTSSTWGPQPPCKQALLPFNLDICNVNCTTETERIQWMKAALNPLVSRKSVSFEFSFCGGKTRFTHAIAANKRANSHNFKIKKLNLLTITFLAVYLMNRGKSSYMNESSMRVNNTFR